MKTKYNDAVLGERVRQAREDKGLQQHELAKRIGASKGYMCQVETGAKVPSVPVLLNIANQLGVSIDWLFGAA